MLTARCFTVCGIAEQWHSMWLVLEVFVMLIMRIVAQEMSEVLWTLLVQGRPLCELINTPTAILITTTSVIMLRDVYTNMNFHAPQVMEYWDVNHFRDKYVWSLIFLFLWRQCHTVSKRSTSSDFTEPLAYNLLHVIMLSPAIQIEQLSKTVCVVIGIITSRSSDLHSASDWNSNVVRILL